MKGRKRIRLPAAFCVGRRKYFLTLCTRNRLRFFNNASLAQHTVESLQTAAAREDFLLHAWCVMPDHAHALVEGRNDLSRLCIFVDRWKNSTLKNFDEQNRRELWQRTFFDRTLRDGDSIYTIAWYIWLNPVRARLCQNPDEYPFSGSMTMDWKAMIRPNEDWTPTW